jgi:hypothetical protein
MTTAQILISDPTNAITYVMPRRRGELYLQQGRNQVSLNADELTRFIDAARQIEREASGVVSTTTTPAKARLGEIMRYEIKPEAETACVERGAFAHPLMTHNSTHVYQCTCTNNVRVVHTTEQHACTCLD